MYPQEGSHQLDLPIPKFVQQRSGGAAGSGDALAPMPGVIEKINCAAGDKVEAGDPLVIMIAMKMEVSRVALVVIGWRNCYDWGEIVWGISCHARYSANFQRDITQYNISLTVAPFTNMV